MDEIFVEIATGRKTSLFQDDVEQLSDQIREAVLGKSILVIGGAGSIGSATVQQLIQFEPNALHIIDQNENELAEIIRTLRSASEPLKVKDLRILPIDYGSVAFRMFVLNEGPYDLVLNFAAIKHVRSEKDAFSTMQMFDTNIVKQERLLRVLEDAGFTGRYFSVSTDKAANPTSMMGASKRVMEHVMFDADMTKGLDCTITSARFANVAYSNGSLLQSFENRLAKRQPLAAPEHTKRYFVSLEESGQLCLLAATTAPHNHLLIPRLDPEVSLVEMQAIAEGFLKNHGYEPSIYLDEDKACLEVAENIKNGQWPLLVTKLTTSGEKPFEEFVGGGENAVELGYNSLMAVPYLPLKGTGKMLSLLQAVSKLFENASHGGADASPAKNELRDIIAIAEPGFLDSHKDTGISLDDRV